MKKVLLLFSAALLAASSAMAQVTVDFEDITLEDNSFDLGKNLEERAFVSGGFRFFNGYADYSGYDYFDGFAISTSTATNFNSSNFATDQFNSCVGSGAGKSKTYAVYFNPYVSGAASITNNEGRYFTPQSVAVTNNAYAFNSLTNGDSFAKRFTEEDWFQLYIIGKKDGQVTDSVTVNLAADGMLLFTWKNIDLTALGEVDSIIFRMNSTDVGASGMNTPAYFCLDNFVTLVGEKSDIQDIKAPAKRADIEGIYSLDGTQLSAPQRGINVIRLKDGSSFKMVR